LVASCGGGGSRSKSSTPTRSGSPLGASFPGVVVASNAQTKSLFDEVGVRKRLGAEADAVYALLLEGRLEMLGRVRPLNATTARAAAFTRAPTRVRLVVASVQAVVLPGLFAQEFAYVVDAYGVPGGPAEFEFPPEKPSTSTVGDGARTVFTTMTRSQHVSKSSSTVTYTMTATIRQVVTDDKTHAQLATIIDARTYRGTINFCPDLAGGVPASVTLRTRITGPHVGGSDDASVNLQGHVSDQATLTGIDAEYHDIRSWDTGGVTLDINKISLNGTNNGFDIGSLAAEQSSVVEHDAGDATAANVTSSATDGALDVELADAAFGSAEKLWQHGRCVVVAVPKFNAETPIRIEEWNDWQHIEEVDKGSDTTFGVVLKHRFGAPPNAPIDLTLSGDKKIDPDHLDAAPGQITYTAPDEDDKTATLTLTSTSKRGIGKLIIKFDTKSKKLALSMNGNLTFGSGPVTLTALFRAASAPFKPVGDGTYRASLPATTTYTLTFPGENCTSATGSEGSGTLVFTGTIDKGPDNQPLWHVKLDGKRSAVHTNETACGKSFANLPLSGTSGGLVGAMASISGVITFPADGGTVHVNKSLSGLHMNATFVATVPR
jgi:hypothetical protein